MVRRRAGRRTVGGAKSEGSTNIHLQIATAGPLGDLLARCRDSVVSPYLIHRLPEKARPSNRRAKDRGHHTQVLAEQLSRAFTAAMYAAGIDTDNPPTFHEIRNLGGALLKDAGWNNKIQALMGYSNVARTGHCLGNHETPWQAVSTGIALPR